MISFENKVCPLCQKVLLYKSIFNVGVYYCSTNYTFYHASGVEDKPHYEVEIDNYHQIQHMYVLPWAIDNFGDTYKSRIYKITSEVFSGGVKFQKWKFIKEVPQIHADTEDILINRINTLMMFL